MELADEVPQDRGLEVEAETQEPIEAESRGKEVAQVVDRDEINVEA